MNKSNFILDPNLALYLPLSELDGSSFMSRDACGHRCTANGTIWRPAGRYFDGVDNSINIDTTLVSVGSSTSKTLIVWANSDKTDYSTEGRIIVLHRTVGTTAFALLTLGNPATWRAGYVTGSTTLVKLDSGIPLIIGQPTFLAIVQDGNCIRFQVDDTVVTASNAGATTMSNPANVYIGAYSNNGTPALFFKGIIGEACVFSRALNPLEVERVRLATKYPYQ